MQTNLLALKKSGLVLDINPDIYAETNFSANRGRSDVSGLMFPDRGHRNMYRQKQTRPTGLYRLIRHLSGSRIS